MVKLELREKLVEGQKAIRLRKKEAAQADAKTAALEKEKREALASSFTMI